LADFLVNSNVKWRQVVFVLYDELRMLFQKQAQAVDVAVLAAEMARRVPIHILRVDVHLFLDQGLDHAEIAANASHMQRSTKILGPAVEITAKFRKDFDKFDMSFVCCHMHRCPPIAIALVKQRLCQLPVLLSQELDA
jgi:hypothetical protein